MREIVLRATLLAYAALVIDVHPAQAGYRCGRDGEPDPTVGCKCPPSKQARRDSEDWVCVAAVPPPPSLRPPELWSPEYDARDVTAQTQFTVLAPTGAHWVEIELCDDLTCRIPGHREIDDVYGEGTSTIMRVPDLLGGRKIFWHARGGVGPAPGPWSLVHWFTTADTPRGRPVQPAAAAGTTSESEREAERRKAATAIVPAGSACLPNELRSPSAPRLELAAIGSSAVVCAIDQNPARLLGPVACWTVQISGENPGAITYTEPVPLPGRGMPVTLDGRCARSYCLPNDAAVPADSIAQIVWSEEAERVAVLAGDTVHVYNAATKAHERSFSIRGDRGVTSEPIAIYWNGNAIFIEASNHTTSPIWVFKLDGTALGPIEAVTGTTVPSTRHGSFLLLRPDRVAISEDGFSTLTTYEPETGKRTRLTRKLRASTCKKTELDVLWNHLRVGASPACGKRSQGAACAVRAASATVNLRSYSARPTTTAGTPARASAARSASEPTPPDAMTSMPVARASAAVAATLGPPPRPSRATSVYSTAAAPQPAARPASSAAVMPPDAVQPSIATTPSRASTATMIRPG